MLGAKPHINIGSLKLVRAYAPSDSKVQLREYLPEGETLERWNRLASVRILKKEKDPKKYLERVAAMVMKSHPSARAILLMNDEKHTLILDFMMFAPKTAPEHFVEWNLMKAKYIKGTGLIVYQYAFRIYNPKEENIDTLKSERKSMTTPFGDATFEEIE